MRPTLPTDHGGQRRVPFSERTVVRGLVTGAATRESQRPSQPLTRGPVMRERNIEVVRAWIDDAWSGGNLAVADDLLTEEFVLHDPVASREVVGRDAERALISGLRQAIPDLTFTIDDIVADGDDVTIRWLAEGTHGGELLGFAATGRALAIRG